MEIQKICKLFREEVLKKTLLQLSEESGINLKTISAFENGRSNNINHLKIYANACRTELEFIFFIKNISEALGGRNGN